MATKATRLKRDPLGEKRKTDLTLTGLLMEGLERSPDVRLRRDTILPLEASWSKCRKS
jgi:hypothetical protein